MKYLPVLVILASSFLVISADFDKFVKKYNKKYSTQAETEIRAKKYLANCKKVDELNAKAEKAKSTARFAANKFSDLDPVEFAGKYLGVIPGGIDKPRKRSLAETTTKTTTTKTTTTKTTTTRTTTTRTTTTRTTTTRTTTTRTTTTRTTTTRTTTTRTTTTRTTTTKTTTTKTTTSTTTKTTTTPTTTMTTTTTTPIITSTTSTPNNLVYFDWTTQAGIVAPVKNQQSCGSCWAFSTIGVLESFYALQGNPLTVLSEQLLVDCNDGLGITGGCSGSYVYAAFDFAMANGTERSSDYPYISEKSTCKYNPSKVVYKINSYGWSNVESNYMSLLVTYGPMVLHINGNALQLYSSGVLDLSICATSPLNHAVILVGYGTDNTGKKYWRIKNSWDTWWGESGFVRVKRDENACGIASYYAFYVKS